MSQLRESADSTTKANSVVGKSTLSEITLNWSNLGQFCNVSAHLNYEKFVPLFLDIPPRSHSF